MKKILQLDNDSARARKLRLLGLVVLVAAVLWGGWHFLYARHHVNTDNAYVVGNVIQITPQTVGTIQAIQSDETDAVKTGQVLIQLDPTDAKLALEQARVDLAKTVRDVAGAFANTQALQAQYESREAEARRAEDDLQRRTPLAASGAVSQEELQHAQTQQQAARNLAASARAQWLTAQSQTAGLSVADHPSVQRAAARVREAALALARCDLLSPVDGQVAKRSAQVGQRVQPGTPLMSVVARDQLWVDANFKESQLADLRIGQEVELEADVYGSKVTYHGKIAGLGAGTGAAFALLPAQNATGNWIKVVQRVPVRIQLDMHEVQSNPLRVGLSMDVTVDTSNQSGPRLADAPRQEPVSSTPIYQTQDASVGAEIARIIATNLVKDGGARQP